MKVSKLIPLMGCMCSIAFFFPPYTIPFCHIISKPGAMILGIIVFIINAYCVLCED